MPMDLAPRDNTIVRLLIEWTPGADVWGPLTDEVQSWTIGFNSLEHTEIDQWQYVGWSWQSDVFFDCCTSKGHPKPIGWLPLGAEAKSKTIADVKASADEAGVSVGLLKLWLAVEGESWEPKDPGHPAVLGLIERGYVRRADGICGFERIKDAMLAWTEPARLLLDRASRPLANSDLQTGRD